MATLGAWFVPCQRVNGSFGGSNCHDDRWRSARIRRGAFVMGRGPGVESTDVVYRAPDMASFFVWGQGWFLTS